MGTAWTRECEERQRLLQEGKPELRLL